MLAVLLMMSTNPAEQYKAFAAMNQSYHHHTPLTPGGASSHHHDHYMQQNWAYSDLVGELKHTQGQLSFARTELDRIQVMLDDAEAQAKHDRELIAGMQSRISELESNVNKGKATAVGSSHSGASSLARFNNDSSRRSISGRKDSNETETSPRFPDFCDESASQHSRRSDCAERKRELTNPSSPAGPISPTADLFSPFPSMVLGHQFTKSIKIEDPTFNAKDFGQKLAALWETTESFVKAYTNAPNADGDRLIQGKLLEYVMWGFNKHIIASLMNDKTTRFLVVAKALNSFIARDILKLSIVQGFDSTADSEIAQLKTNCYANTPTVVKRPMYDAVGKQIVRIRNISLFNNFYNKRMHDNSKDAFDMLSALIRHREQAAWTEMANLMREAHNLALQMYSGPYEFNFIYAKMNDTFDPTVMVDREAIQDHTRALELQGSGRARFRVKFAVTPLMYFRNVSVTPMQSMETACAAQVLLQDLGTVHYHQYQHEHSAQRFHEHSQWQQQMGDVECGPGMMLPQA